MKTGNNIFCNFIIFYFLTVLSLKAQDIPINYVGWYSYNGYHTFSQDDKWAFVAEGTIQRNNIIIQPMQYAYRVGSSYQFDNGNRVASGYAFQYNFPYDDASVPYNAINRRIWEQFTMRKSFKSDENGFFSHRFRLEQIWTQQKAAPDYSTTSYWKFDNVLRYQFLVNLPLNQDWSASLYDEIFLNLYDFENQKIINQNRIYAGVIHNLDKNHLWKISAGYMFQSVWNTNESQEGRKRINNVLRIAIISDLSFNRKKNK